METFLFKRESSLKQSSVFNLQSIDECESMKLGPSTKKEKLKFDLVPPLLKILGYATAYIFQIKFLCMRMICVFERIEG